MPNRIKTPNCVFDRKNEQTDPQSLVHGSFQKVRLILFFRLHTITKLIFAPTRQFRSTYEVKVYATVLRSDVRHEVIRVGAKTRRYGFSYASMIKTFIYFSTDKRISYATYKLIK